MLLRLSHIIVYCSQMERSVRFYRDQLGLPVKFESPDWTEFHSGATTLALHLANHAAGAAGEHRNSQAGQAHPSLEVLDLDRFYEEKKAKGIEFLLPPAMQDFGRRMAVVRDPDGLPISVTEEQR